ncbi:hypothetical protein BDQ17DRAFT_1346441 [Cyathus striatus]|nr:hypothetical protein BDQ17DRAFT_1346441 [Cyathus striatus]
MSLYTYVDPPNTNLICCICRAPFTDPITARTCSHTFCHDCILQALIHAPQCPVDRSLLSTDDLAPANPIVRCLVDELAIECIHRSEGCSHTCQRQLLAVHLREECPHAEVKCPQEGCNVFTKRMDMEVHTKMHNEEDGIEAQEQECVDVENNDTTRESKGVQTSSPSSPPSHESRISLLTEQNILLPGLSCIKASMGPWYPAGGSGAGYRPEGTSSDVPPPASSNELPTRLQPSTASTSAAAASYFHYVAEDAPHLQNSIPSREPYNYARDAIGPYFPSDNDEQQQQYHHLHYGHQHPFSNMTRPVMGHHPSSSSIDAGHSGGAFTRPISASIAPLNLGGTLEGTLNGLRESMVTLAAGVDSLGRRSEIALTNETLRLGEEVMSLRAGLHGLRMQVHAMMMDRNVVITGRGGGNGLEGAIPGPEGWMPQRMHFGMQGGGQGPQSFTKL